MKCSSYWSSLRQTASSACLVVLLLAVAGCSGEASTARTEPTTSEPSTTKPDPTTTPTPTTVISPPESTAPSEPTAPVATVPSGATPETAEAALAYSIATVSQPCPDGFPEKLECGQATVPLDWTNPDAASITTWFGLMRATEPSKGVVIPFYGGPGGSLAEVFDQYKGLTNAFPDRHVLLTDVRGTGLSSRLGCAEFDGPGVNIGGAGPGLDAAVVGCLESLGPDPALYTTVSAVLDVEALRRALDLVNPTVYGVSYGTQVANVYGALFPDDLSSVILDGAYDSSDDLLSLSRTKAIRLGITNSCMVSGCDAQQTLDTIANVAATLRAEPISVDGLDPITESFFAAASVGYVQEDPGSYISAVEQAADGDWQPLVELLDVARIVPFTSAIKSSAALSFSVQCTDGPLLYDAGSAPEERDAAIESALVSVPVTEFLPFSAEAWLGSGWVWSGSCDDAPAFDVPDALAMPIDPLYPDVPVLLVHGTRDIQTPLASAYVVAEQYPNSVLVEVPDATHDLLSVVPCVFDLVVEFVNTRTLPPADSCARAGE
jgi:pimeloyl-ACP methyl ester carboxylesterase